MNTRLRLFLHQFFNFSIIEKAVNGTLEVVAGFILIFLGPNALIDMIPRLVQKELLEDPNDFISNHLLQFSYTLHSDTQLFLIIYLFVHGSIKACLAIALSSTSYGAYKVSGIILTIFVGYQLYRFSHTLSVILFLFILMDVLTVYLIHAEAKKLKHSHKNTV